MALFEPKRLAQIEPKSKALLHRNGWNYWNRFSQSQFIHIFHENMNFGDLTVWSLVPPALIFLAGQFALKIIGNWKEKNRFERTLKPFAGVYTVHRKSGDQFPHMSELTLSWDKEKYNALKFNHDKPLTDATEEKEKQGSTGFVYFKDELFGDGFYKSNNSNHYGLASFILFESGEIGYYRVYVRDDDSKPHMVSTNREISTQFILKRKT